MAPSCVAVGLVASQYGIVWAMCINGLRVSLSFWALCLLQCRIFHCWKSMCVLRLCG